MGDYWFITEKPYIFSKMLLYVILEPLSERH